MQNIVDALQKHNVKKAAVERSLAMLVEKGKVSKKEYGKAKIFIVRQDKIDMPDDDDMVKLDAEIKTLTSHLTDAAARTEKMQGELVLLNKEYTLEEARKRNEELTNELDKKEEKREALGDGSELVSKDDKLKMDHTYYNVRSLWKKYKRIVTDIANQIGEATGKKNAELYEEMGIETDKAVNVDISDFPEIQNPLKTKRSTTAMCAPKRQRQK